MICPIKMSKRRRASITAGMKKELCQYKIDHPSAKLSELTRIFSEKWDTVIGRTTIGDIIRESNKWLSMSDHFEGIRRVSGGKYHQLEAALFKSFIEARSHNQQITDEWLLKNAQLIGRSMNVTNFKYSTGWLCRFKKRYVISKSTVPGQSTLVSQGEFDSQKSQHSTVIKPMESLIRNEQQDCMVRQPLGYMSRLDNATGNEGVTVAEAKESLIKVISFFTGVAIREDYLCALFTLLKYLETCSNTAHDGDLSSIIKCENNDNTLGDDTEVPDYADSDDREPISNCNSVVDIKQEATSSNEDNQSNNEPGGETQNDDFYDDNCDVSEGKVFLEEQPMCEYIPGQCTEKTDRTKKKDRYASYVKFSEQSMSYKCDICGKTFLTYHRCRRHVKLVHSGERPYKCPVCDKTFPENATLKKHSRIHTGERPFLCTLCGKNLCTAAGLAIHMRCHSGEKTFTCSLCHKAFAHPSGLSRHRRVHSGEKPYTCSVCGKAFKRTTDLTVHKRIHTGEHPYKCIVCEKKFTKWSYWNDHMRMHTGERPFNCQLCGRAFAFKALLTKHLRVHTGERPFCCTDCGKRFSQNGSLYHHKKMHKK